MKDFLKQIVYGGLDGIITTFAVVASFSGATLGGLDFASATFITVLLFGLGNLFADGLSMGLGDFLSSRAEIDLRDKRVLKLKQGLSKNSAQFKDQTLEALRKLNFSDSESEVMWNTMSTNKAFLAEFIQNYAIEADGRGSNPAFTGFATFISFLVLGSIPLIPFALAANWGAERVFIISSVATFCALLILGIIRWKITGQNALSAIGEVVIIGGVAAIAAFTVGNLVG